MATTTKTVALAADKKAARALASALTSAANKASTAYRTFTVAFCDNHAGQSKADVKAAMRALRESGAFGDLAKQSVDNISSMAQYAFALPAGEYATLIAAPNFYAAYTEMRWPKKAAKKAPKAPPADTGKPGEQEEAEEPGEPEAPSETYDERANRIITDINTSLEDLAELLRLFPQHTENAAVEALIRDIVKALTNCGARRIKLQNAA